MIFSLPTSYFFGLVVILHSGKDSSRQGGLKNAVFSGARCCQLVALFASGASLHRQVEKMGLPHTLCCILKLEYFSGNSFVSPASAYPVGRSSIRISTGPTVYSSLSSRARHWWAPEVERYRQDPQRPALFSKKGEHVSLWLWYAKRMISG